MMTDAQKIDQIEHSLRNYALKDIKIVSKQNTLIACFILCSCFIEHICTFRYGMKKNISAKEFKEFVDEYLNKDNSNKYDAEKLRDDLRNKLVHNYSLGETYGLTKGNSAAHLTKLENSLICLNLEDFIIDLEKSFDCYVAELRADKDGMRELALNAFEKVKVISL